MPLIQDPNNPDQMIEDPNPTPQNQNSTGPTNSNVNELELLRTLADTNARNAREEQRRREELEAELTRLRNPAPAPKTFTAEDFFADPMAALNQAVTQQIQPLREFTAQMQRQQAYTNLKNQFLADPQYGSIVTSLGFKLDAIMANLEPTQSNMINAIYSLVGQYALSNPQLFAPKVDNSSTTTTTQEPPKTVVTPPHLRPSAAPSPSGAANNAPKRQYTENERRLMREGGYTEEEWEVLLSSGSNLDAVREFRAKRKAGK